MNKFSQLTLLSIFLLSALAAQAAEDQLWQDVNPNLTAQRPAADSPTLPKKYRLVDLNVSALQSRFSTTRPESKQLLRSSQSTITLPMPEGELLTFRIVESAVMAPELAAKFPELKTYQGEAVDDPTITVRLDWTVNGFHAMIFKGAEVIYIDPYQQGDTQRYINYYKRDAQPIPRNQTTPDVIEQPSSSLRNLNARPANLTARSAGATLRTYRIAVATTGEYTQFFGGTKTGGLSAVITAVNRVSGIYEKEIAVRLQLVGNNDQIIYTDATTDPYTNSDGSALTDENQLNLDKVIGTANYDIGHVFGTGGGGLAGLGVVCDNAQKGNGETGSSTPTKDAFWVDYVAHEIGHQFGANHTFNSPSGSCARNGEPGSNYEIGSGSTIMGYAGICNPDNLQPHTDPYFHSHSFDEIITYITSGTGNSCGIASATGNTAPTVNQGNSGMTIPKQTPFMLNGSGTDADGDKLTYSWEEYDSGSFRTLAKTKELNMPSGNLGTVPLFRVFPPLFSPNRYLPRYNLILNNLSSHVELLPNYARQLKFRLTARDNRGGVTVSNVKTINVTDKAGPFTVTYPNSSLTWKAGKNTAIVSWNVANTQLSPVNCQAVNIALLTGTSSFLLLKQTPNDGMEIVNIPKTTTNTGRIKVSCSNNLFFDLSNSNITVTNPSSPDLVLQAAYGTQAGTTVGKISCNVPGATETISLVVGSVAGFSNPVQLRYLNLPTGFAGSFSANPVASPYSKTTQARVTLPATLTPKTYSFQIEGSATNATTQKVNVEMGIASTLLQSPAAGGKLSTSTPTFRWLAVAGAQSYILEIASDSAFSSIVRTATVTKPQYVLTSNLEGNTKYYWRVKTVNGCGKAMTATSLTRSFTTPATVCSSPIKTDSTLISDSMTLSGTLLKDLNMFVQLAHPYMGDVSLSLTHVATGKTVKLMPNLDDGNCAAVNLNTTFDDESTTALTCSNTNSGRTYKPLESLSGFDGESLNGEWRLDISDVYPSSDDGTLQKWCLTPTL